jgi:exodeoxyribonuclease VII large subunit
MNRQPVSVSKLTSYIKSLFEEDMELSNVLVRGEISNFKYHSSGHMYFTLKDENAKIKCVMFKGYNAFLRFIPEDGMNVILEGYISLYEKDGQYQLYCCKMEPDGIGSLYLAYEQLKARLQMEGLFDVERKKPLPLFPRRIGVATSPTGAVIRDIINVSTRRFNNISILLYPVKVQGDGAAESIVNAIQYFNTRDDIDVIIIGRGGGSIEELWAFNEEKVARAICSSSIPVISAVGHETDFTIADFTADVRASTPSHAAEIAVPSREEIIFKIESIKGTIYSNLRNSISEKRYHIKSIVENIKGNSPKNKIIQYIQYVDSMQSKINLIIQNKMAAQCHRLALLAGRLDGVSPAKVLSRGFSFVEKDGNIIKTVKYINKDDDVKIRMKDGTLECRVIDITEGELWKQEEKR